MRTLKCVVMCLAVLVVTVSHSSIGFAELIEANFSASAQISINVEGRLPDGTTGLLDSIQKADSIEDYLSATRSAEDYLKETEFIGESSIYGFFAAAAAAKGEIKVKDGGNELNLGINIGARGSSNAEIFGSGNAIAETSFSDNLSFFGDGDIPLVVGQTKLRFLFEFDGKRTTDGFAIYGDLGVSASSGNDSAGIFYNAARFGSASTESHYYQTVKDGIETQRQQFFGYPTAGLSFEAVLGPENRIPWSVRMFGEVDAIQGFINFDYSRTLRFTGVEFLDGSTPEDHGFNLSFDSGLTSPNLINQSSTVVPEPASMALWGLGSLGMGVMVRRRKRLTETETAT